MADPYAGRRYSDRTGKGLYEDQAEGLSSGLRQLFGGGVSPRKSEGTVTPMAAATLTPSAPQPSASSQPSASQGDLRRFDTGGDAQRPGLAAGYSASQTRTPGVMRVDGGRSPLFTNINPAEAVEGLRGGTVSNIGDANEGLARMARANAIRQEQLDAAGGPKVAMIENSDKAQWGRDIDKFSMVGKSGGRAGRAQQALDLQEAGLRQRAEEAAMRNNLGMAQLEAQQRDAAARNALAERSLNENVTDRRDRLGLDRERFEFEKAPKPMGALDQVRLAEAQYGLRERIADRARKELEGRGLNPDQQNRVLENVGDSLVDTDPARMQTELAKHLPTLRATDIANQYNIGGVTSTGDVTPVGLRGYNLSEVDLFGNDDPNAPTLSEYLWNLGNDKAIVEDSAGDAGGKPVRLINAARVKSSGDGKNIDLLRRLGIK